MNPYHFEIVKGQTHRYFWQLVTYGGGEREVIARSARDWRTAAKAFKFAAATRDAARSADIVMARLRPGDIRFKMVKDVVALHVTGHGSSDGNGHHRDTATYPTAETLTQTGAPKAGDGATQVDSTGDGASAAPMLASESGKPNGDVADSPTASTSTASGATASGSTADGPTTGASKAAGPRTSGSKAAATKAAAAKAAATTEAAAAKS